MLRTTKCKKCGAENLTTLVYSESCYLCHAAESREQAHKQIKKEKIIVGILITALAILVLSIVAFPTSADWTQTTKKYDHVLQREYLETETISNERPWVTEYTQIRQDPLYEDKYYIEEGPFTSPLSDDWLGD